MSDEQKEAQSVFNINMQVSGSGNQVNTGQRVEASQTHNHGAAKPVDVKALLAKMREEMQREMPDQFQQLEQDFFAPTEELLDSELPDDPAAREEAKAKVFQLLNRIEPFITPIRQTIAAFAEGALVSAVPPPGNWLVGGLLEVIRQNRQY